MCKYTLIRRSLEKSLNQLSVNDAIINSQNMKLGLCSSHTHDPKSNKANRNREKENEDDDDQEEKEYDQQDNDETQEGLEDFLNGRPSESERFKKSSWKSDSLERKIRQISSRISRIL